MNNNIVNTNRNDFAVNDTLATRVCIANRHTNNLFALIEERNRLLNSVSSEIAKERFHHNKGYIVLMCLGFLLILPLFLIIPSAFIVGIPMVYMEEQGIIVATDERIYYCIVIIFIALVSISTLLIWNTIRKTFIKKFRAAQINYQKQANEKSVLINDFLKKYSSEMDIIPPKYRYPLATNYIEELFMNGRAISMMEALDKFEEYLHRLRVEESLKQNLAIQQAQQQQIEDLKNMLLWDAILG